jgi:hypothetical protein
MADEADAVIEDYMATYDLRRSLQQDFQDALKTAWARLAFS